MSSEYRRALLAQASATARIPLMRWLWVASALAGFGALVAPDAASQNLPRPPAELTQIGSVGRSGGLGEVSGVAVSRRHPGILWMHNDSGDQPTISAVRPSGDLVARFEVRGARVVDWEDIALGPCPDQPAQDCLYIGDLGDNAERRTRGIVYIVPEPDPLAGREPRVVTARSVRVRYVDGPHDIEAVAVDPEGHLHLVTKGRTNPILRYRIAREDLLKDSVAVEPRGALPITAAWMLGRWVTGAAMTQDGRRVVVRTYTELYVFDRSEDDVWTLRPPVCWLGVAEPQGEAVDFLDPETLVLVSEATLTSDGPILRVRC